MKFKAIVGNPPYQVNDGGGSKGISASPIYHTFVSIATQIKPQFVSMIIPARWYAGGKGLDEFRESMLTDKRIEVLTDFPKSRDCFSSADIAGGVCYFLWNDKYQGNCRFTSSIGPIRNTCERDLSEFKIFIRDNIGLGIIKKVLKNSTLFYSSRIFPNKPFGLRTYARGEALPFDGALILHSSNGIGYIREEEVTKNMDLIDYYKVYIGLLDPDRAGVNNATGGRNVITKVRTIGPKEVITETYLMLDALKSKRESDRCAKYFKTKFSRALLSIGTTSLMYSKDSFQFVPLFDYTDCKIINWDSNIQELNISLMNYFNLTEDEIAYIEQLIKPMD